MKRCPQCNRVESDQALKFCRVDGATLVTESTAAENEGGTAHFVASPDEVHTSILPLRTDAGISRATGPTTTLPPPIAPTSAALAKPKRQRIKITIAIVAGLLIVAVGTVFGISYFSGRSGSAIGSIAVLPFENQSGNPDSDYLSDGLTESLIYRLSQLPNLTVSPTSSVRRYKGKEVDARNIGTELGVNAVMSGRIVQRGDNLAISVELVDVRTNKLIWGEHYERKLSQLLTTQREIASTIADKLHLKLAGNDAKGINKRYTESNEAYQLYLKGRFYWNKRTIEGLKQAATYYQQAIEKDSGFALAYSGLAESYVLFPPYSVAPPRDSMPRAKAAALKALELDDSLAEAHAALGLYLSIYAWNPAASEKELRRAIELNPNYATAYQWLGGLLMNGRRFDEAIVASRRAEELDPLSVIISADTAYNLIFARRYDEALAQLQRTVALDPNFYYAHYLFGWAYYKKGMYQEAIAAYRKSLELNPEPYGKSLLALALSKTGGRTEAVKLRDDLAAESAQRYLPGYHLAIANMAIGDRDAAFSFLEKDIEERGTPGPGFAIDPILDELRSDPRFAMLVKKIESSKID